MRIEENIGKLRTSISIPSYENTYSIAIKYCRDFFLSKFNKDYFKSFQLVGKNVIDDYRGFNINEALIKETPAVAMRPQIDYDFNRDNIDLYTAGLNHFVRSSKLERSFFKDYKRNIFIGVCMEGFRMNCEFRVKLSEKAQQLRMYKYMQMAMRVGGVFVDYIDVDFHIPYSLMVQLAMDTGFKVENDDIIDKIGFLTYLNSHSVIPILMKYRNINGRVEYFLRLSEVYTRVRVPDNISVDEGEMQGQTYNNFLLEMSMEFNMPSPKMFIYYSMGEQNYIDPTNSLHDNNVSMDLCTIKIPSVKMTNEKGWDLQITTDIEEDNLEQLVFNLDDLFTPDTEIYKLIKYNNSILVSSDVFLDFKIYNDGDLVDYTIDWKTMTLRSNHKLRVYVSNVFIYINMNYLNEYTILANDYYKDTVRINKEVE